MLKEFREFIERGNVIEFAVAFILGLAFNAIVKSLVNDMIMPVVGLITGGADFTNRFLVLGSGSFDTLAAAQEAGVATLNYGVFINTVIRVHHHCLRAVHDGADLQPLPPEAEEAPRAAGTAASGSAARRNPGRTAQPGELIGVRATHTKGELRLPFFVVPAFVLLAFRP